MAPSDPPEIDTSRPHPARMWNYWIGGKDHYEIDRQVGDQAPAGFVGFNDGTGVIDKEGREEGIRIAVEQGSTPYVARTPDEIAAFFAGLELLEPGVVSTSQWRPEATPFGPPPLVDAFCGLALKP